MTEREIFFNHLGQTSQQPMGLQIEKAEGVYLFDQNGNRYFDLVSGFSVSNIGHRNPVVIEAIHKQLEKYLYLNVYGEFIQSPQVRLAEKLCENLPPALSSIFLVNSGSEAIEGAMKLAKRYTGRTEIIAFKNAYHGSTQGSLSVLGDEELRNAFRPLLPDVRHIGFNNFGDLAYITEKTACVIIEPLQAEAGVILPKSDFLSQLRKRCNETGTQLVFDEVQTGFGRTGKLFCFENYGIHPDILVLAKAMGGGMPIGAFVSSKEIMNTLAFNPELGHITTFGGHPVSCAAALASLSFILENNLPERGEERGKMIEGRLKFHPFIKEIRRQGLMLGIEIIDSSFRTKLTQACLDEGIIIDWFLFSPNTFRIAPPLVITEAEVEEVTSRLLSVFDKMTG